MKMFKKIVGFVLVIVMALSLMAGTALAVSEARVAVGADNSEDQLAAVYGVFGINRGDVKELAVTNQNERDYLAGLVPDEKIGNVALSCVYIEEKDSGGIDLKTQNINWVTEDMYKSALATAGISNAKVVVAAYKPVSGTGALAGIYKAYEDMTGLLLDETAKETAFQELVITGELQEMLGDDASAIINDLKGELSKTKTMTDDEIRALINEVAGRYEAVLTPDQVEQILSLVKKFNELNIDPDTFLKLAQAGNGVSGFFENVGGFFEKVGTFFTDLFSGNLFKKN